MWLQHKELLSTLSMWCIDIQQVSLVFICTISKVSIFQNITVHDANLEPRLNSLDVEIYKCVIDKLIFW